MTDSDFDSLLAGGSQPVNAFKVSALYQESCMRDLGFTPSVLSQRLNESLVLLLPLQASYSFDSQSNELVYLLPGPSTHRVLQRERAKRYWKDYIWETVMGRILPVAMGVVKTVFGCFLVLSLSVVVLALLALLFASSHSRGNGGGGGGMGSVIGGRGRFFSPFRFWYWPVGGGGGLGAAQVVRRTSSSTLDISFVEAVFSFVFGDGPPQEEDEWFVDLRRFLVGKRNLRAFQFCAFLPNPPAIVSVDKLDKEHEFMSLVLSRFQGQVSSVNGDVLVYNFPILTTNNPLNPKTLPQMYRQSRKNFSMASSNQIKLCIGLGTTNLLAVLLLVVLGSNDEFVHRAIARGGMLAGNALKLAHGLFPVLLGYALVFALVPLARYGWLTRRNRQIDEANQLRELWRRQAQDLLLTESA